MRSRSKSLVMADKIQNKSDDDEFDNEDYGCELDFDSLIRNAESNDSKTIISILQNQTKIIKDLSFGVKYLKMKVKAVNNRVKTNEDKISSLENENGKKSDEIEQLKTQVRELNLSNRKLVSETNALKGSVENQDIYSKRKNLIFNGVKESDMHEDTYKRIEYLVRNDMGLSDVHIKEAYRRGAKKSTGQPRQIVVKTHSVPQKYAILRKSANVREKGIRITEDLPHHMLNSQRILVPVLRIAKQTDRSAKIVRNKLIYHGAQYAVSQVSTLKIADQVGTRVSENGTLFHGRFSKLSNFYPAPVNDSGHIFSSSEQAYQYRKAMANDSPDIAEQITRVRDPLDAKRIGALVETSPDWDRAQGRIAMKEVVKKKFAQNSNLREYLNSLPQLPIVECNPHDRIWGVGCSLAAAERHFPKVTEDNNQLGKILSELKSEIN